MVNKYKIAILGIGGVGGYIGAKLAVHFRDSKEIDIFFIARGENEKVIKQNGLKLIAGNKETIAHPSAVTAIPAELGPLDLVICCVKSYHLEDSLVELKHCIGSDTVFLPLLNGVDATERTRKIFPVSTVLDGCIYLVSRLIAPGVVEQFGKVHQVYFGSYEYPADKLQKIETILNEAGIDAAVMPDIREICWEKFFFISTIATLSSYLDATIGEILGNNQYKEKLLGLMTELETIARVKGILLPGNIINETLDKLATLPFDTVPSMHTDFKKGHHTELKSTTGYVVSLGKALHVPTPLYDEMLATLSKRSEL
ncbi:MAG: 2-dehydropantoate 2-reductase [Ferruginibacter sp.]